MGEVIKELTKQAEKEKLQTMLYLLKDRPEEELFSIVEIQDLVPIEIVKDNEGYVGMAAKLKSVFILCEDEKAYSHLLEEKSKNVLHKYRVSKKQVQDMLWKVE